MIVKFFSNNSGGSVSAIDYLLNHREKDGTAKVLYGNPILTRKLINSLTFKQKVTVGCLSFEEKNIKEELKYKLMKDFEYHLLPSMDERYNILWVEHTDKNRIELNFVIPKIDLLSQKSLNPYYHKADLHRIEVWQDLQNLKFNFSNPKNPAKSRTLQIHLKHQNLSKDFEKLDELLHSLVSKGQIQNREQLIEICNKNNILVTYKSKDYIYIKLPNAKKSRKFKGSIYNEQFRSIAEFRTISQRTREKIAKYNSRNTQRELNELEQKLSFYTQAKYKYYERKYFYSTNTKSSFNKKEFLKYREFDNKESTSEFNQNYNNDNPYNISNHKYFIFFNYIFNDTNRPKKITKWRVYKNFLFLDNNSQRKLNDSTRTTIIEGIRNKRRVYEQNIQGVQREGELSCNQIKRSNKRVYQSLRIDSKCIFAKIRNSIEESRKQHLEDKKRLPNIDTKFKPTVKEAYERCRNYRREWEELLGTITGVKEINRMVESANEEISGRIGLENKIRVISSVN